MLRYPGKETLIDYSKRFLDLTEMPLTNENLPSSTGINMLPLTMLKLSEASPLFAAVKECARDAMQFSEVVYYLGKRVSVLCGFESMMAAAFLLGAKGGVIATVNLFPQIYVELLKAAQEKDIDKVNKINFDITPSQRSCLHNPNPWPIRCALECLGISTGPPVSPVEMPGQDAKKIIVKVMSNILKYLAQ